MLDIFNSSLNSQLDAILTMSMGRHIHSTPSRFITNRFHFLKGKIPMLQMVGRGHHARAGTNFHKIAPAGGNLPYPLSTFPRSIDDTGRTTGTSGPQTGKRPTATIRPSKIRMSSGGGEHTNGQLETWTQHHPLVHESLQDRGGSTHIPQCRHASLYQCAI